MKRVASFAAACGLIVAGCGGGSEEAAPTTQPPVSATAAATVATTPTTPAPNTPVTPITEGAKVVVVNASRVDGAAKRMSDQLKDVGYTVGTPTGSGSTLQRIDVSKVFYIENDAQAKVVADNLKLVLGGGNIEVAPMPTPAPTENGELEAGTTVVVAVGNDTADKTLNQLQGITSSGGNGSEPSNSSSTGSSPSTSDATTETDVGGSTGSNPSTTNA